jgi:putative membrane protein
MKLLKPIIVAAVSLFILAYFLPTVSFMHWTTLLIAAAVLAFFNKIIKPILKLLFLPVNIITFGLFSVVINAGLLWLATYLVPGFHITEMVVMGTALNQFWSLVLMSILIGLTQSVVGFVL